MKPHNPAAHTSSLAGLRSEACSPAVAVSSGNRGELIETSSFILIAASRKRPGTKYRGGPTVRIRFPPAESPQTIGSSAAERDLRSARDGAAPARHRSPRRCKRFSAIWEATPFARRPLLSLATP